ncbi:MAG: 3-oxoacyl-ACP reductase FabG [Candidatus Aenigmarchaeota archaeon]|nr:3-oxoacyl-ACP reductase FabG [Candidatus Aenigmarchaeota archaeon]
MRLQGKIALVTGASGGIGRAISLACAREGAAVGVHCCARTQEGRQVVREIQSLGQRAACFPADVAREAAVRAMVRRVVKEFGGLDILVNNAGIYPRTSLGKLTLAAWRKVMDVNLQGPFLLARESLPHLRKRRGCIINIASEVAYGGSRHGAHYGASKAGLVGLTVSLARELAPLGIRVNAVAPGPVNTPLLGDDTPAKRQARIARIPLGRLGRPEDIAAAVVFLASEEASFITGHTLAVNGGGRMR